MKHFHRNYDRRPTETEKKGRRVKNPGKESCKCYAPVVKLHCLDCPVLKRPCPVHGGPRTDEKRNEEKGEHPERNMIISFHPSTKTERLFHPVKRLLAQCEPDTKISLQYYSPGSKESLNQQQSRVNNPVFVEKTKSFVSDKTNKMKKLKQCFYSPCNSIATKSRSQTSLKEKFNEMFQEERRKTDFGKVAPDNPPDDIQYDPTWFSTNFDFKAWEKLSGGARDSDFITVTQQAKNNLINHKIFEIKHKKGITDLPFIQLPNRSTQLVYSSVDITSLLKDPGERRKIVVRSSVGSGEQVEEEKGKPVRDEESSQTSSGSSVYYTPFFFVPAGPPDERMPKKDESVQVEGPYKDQNSSISEGTQTSSFHSERESAAQSRHSVARSVQVQTEPERPSGDSGTQGWYVRNVGVAESSTTRGVQTEELYPSDKNLGGYSEASTSIEETFVTNNESWSSHSEETGSVRTTELQATVHQKSFTSSRSGLRSIIKINKKIQTELSIKWSSKASRGCRCSAKASGQKTANKGTQTVISQSDSEEVSEFIGLDSSNVTYVIKPFGQEDSDQVITKFVKTWWRRSHSDSELQSKECKCVKTENEIPLPQSGLRSSEAGPSKQSKKTGVSYVVPKKENVPEEKPWTARKVNKAVGTDDEAQRLYRRADKGMGTDSLISVAPKTPKKSMKVEATQTESKKPERSPRASEPTGKSEQTSAKADSPRTHFSDLSELTKIIHDFFETSGLMQRRHCTCDAPTVSGNKSEPEGATPEYKKAKKEDGAPKPSDNKVDSETMTEDQKKPKGKSPPTVEIQEISSPREETPVDNRDSNKHFTERVKIRRSVLLDEVQTKTRFICSLCAREISTYSMNAATNTDSSLVLRKADKSNGSEPEKTVRTVQSLDCPQRCAPRAPHTRKVTESEEPERSDACHLPPPKTKTNYGGNEKASWERQTLRLVRVETARQTPTTSFLKAPAVQHCACETPGKICTVGTCPKLKPSPTADSSLKSASPGMPSSQTYKSSQEKKMRRSPESYYRVFIQPHWPKELSWNPSENPRGSVPEKCSSQQKRSYEKDTEPAGTPAGKKIKAETEKPTCFMFGEPASSDLQLGDPRLVSSKGTLVWVPSSRAHVPFLKKNSSFLGKSVKSEEKIRAGDYRQSSVSSEAFTMDGSSELLAAKSCRLTPIALGCDSKQQLVECRVCKSLTFLKDDKDQVFCKLPLGLLAYCPGAPEELEAPASGESSEQLPLEEEDSLTQNFEKLLEECSHFSDSDYPSAEEKTDERSQEDP